MLKNKDRIVWLLAAVVVFLLVAPSTAGAQPIAELSRSANFLEFSPAVGNEGFVLRVSGQGRFIERRSSAIWVGSNKSFIRWW